LRATVESVIAAAARRQPFLSNESCGRRAADGLFYAQIAPPDTTRDAFIQMVYADRTDAQ
jgi:hypothetical protein